jgi:CheY-like chemotaxis protein
MCYSDRFLGVGMNSYMSKPVQKEDLLRALQTTPRLPCNLRVDIATATASDAGVAITAATAVNAATANKTATITNTSTRST